MAKGRNVKSGLAKAPGAATTNRDDRQKNFLTEAEIERLLEAAKGGRHGVRDHVLMLMMYRHGLRVSEAVALRRDEVNLDTRDTGSPVDQSAAWQQFLKVGSRRL